MKLVTKAIHPYRDVPPALQDAEITYRQRYLDMIVNPEVKDTFILRSKIVSLVRRFFEERGFLEVETPMLHQLLEVQMQDHLSPQSFRG